MSDETKNNVAPGKPVTEGVQISQPSPAPGDSEFIKGLQLQQPLPAPSSSDDIRGLHLQQPSPAPEQSSDNNSGGSKK